MAVDAGFDETRSEQVALVVTEACTNLLKHAQEGKLLLSLATDDDDPGIEILALDRGPGIRDVQQCLRDGYTTLGNGGTGLGAIQRLSDIFDIYSVAGRGTAVFAFLRASRSRPVRERRSRIGAVQLPKPGQEVCGDAWSARRAPEGLSVLIADGLGHGPEAAEASRMAVRTFDDNRGADPLEASELIHGALRSTRGAAMAIADVDLRRLVVNFCGVGNIAGAVCLGGDEVRRMVSRNGTAGHVVPRLQTFSYPFNRDSVLVMHSDGISAHWDLSAYPGILRCDPAVIAGVLYRDFARGNDDATVVVAKITEG